MTALNNPAPGSTPAPKTPVARSMRESRWSRIPVNMRWFFGTIIVLAVLIGGGFGVRTWNLARNARNYLAKADAAEQEEKWNEVVANLQLYLQLLPKDADVRIRVAKAYDKVAVEPMAKVFLLTLYDQAAMLAPERSDLLERRLELLVQLGRFKEAEVMSRKLIELKEGGTKASWALALALFTQLGPDNRVTPEEVVQACKAALKENPGDLQLSYALATTYREHFGKPPTEEHAAAADAIIDEMVALSPQNADALLARNQYDEQFRTERVEPNLAKALGNLPKNFQLLLTAGASALVKKDTQQAIDFFKQAIDAAPTNPLGYSGLGLAYAETGDRKLALATWNDGIEHGESPNIALNLRMARALITWGDLDGAVKPLEAMEAELASNKKANSTALANELRLMRCQWYLGRKEFAQALTVLKSVNLNLPGGAGLLAVLEFNRASCYAGLLQWDQAAAAYDAAAKSATAPLQAWLAAADAWERAGRTDLALQRYVKAMQKSDFPPRFKLKYASALLLQQMELPAADRNWSQVEHAVADCQTALPDVLGVKLLEADLKRAKGDGPAAVRILEEAVAAEPKDGTGETVLPALAQAYQQAGQLDKADRAVEKLRKRTGNSWPAVRLHVELLTRRGEYDKALEELRAEVDRVNEFERPEVLERMAPLFHQMKDRKAGYEELVKFSKNYPNDVQVCWQLLNFAVELDNQPDALKYEKQLRTLEGPDGSLWRFAQARRLLGESRDVQDDSFIKAAQLLSQLQGLRPSWVPVYLLGAEVAQRQGNARLSAEQLTRAVDLGARQPEILQQLMNLLYQQGRMSDAEQLLARVGDLGKSTGSVDLASMAIARSLADRDYDHALHLAEEGVRARPDESASHWWLGRALLAARRPTEAEAAFRNAVRKGTQEVRNWLALVSFYSQIGEGEKARSTVKKMKQFLKLSGAQQPFVWAQAQELAGDIPAAAQDYRAAVAAAADDINVQQRAATFFEARDPALAEQCLKRVLEISPKAQNARRSLAMILAGGGESRWKEAWELISPSSATEIPSAADRRIQVRMLFRNGGEQQRAQARKLLEGLVADSKQSIPDDLLMLAQLNESDKNVPAAKEQLLRLVNQKKPEPAALLRLVDFMMRHNELDEADPWLTQLEAAVPDSFAPVQLRAHWLKAKDRSDEIEPLISKYEQHQMAVTLTAPQNAGLLLNCAALYAAVGNAKSAEATYRKLVAADPQYYVILAEWLFSQKKAKQAIDLCASSASSDTTATAAVQLAKLLVKYNVVKQQSATVEKVLADALEAHGDDPGLLLTVAELRKQQGRRDDAERLYRRLLDVRPDHGIAANNLAWMLSERPEGCEEALSLVEKALEQLGHNPEVLDTKGMILLRQHNAPQAVDTLRQATKSPGANPASYLHLSLAYRDAGNKARAREELQTFRRLKPDAGGMTEEEKRQLAELESALAQ